MTVWKNRGGKNLFVPSLLNASFQ